MTEFAISSRCECQASLSATLDDKHHVVAGHAKLRGAKLVAAAHSIGANGDRFDVGWLCPFCNRNTLRTFHVGAIRTVAPQSA